DGNSIFGERTVLAVANDTDDLAPGTLRAANADSAADRSGSGEVDRRGGGIEDDDWRPALAVGVGEVASAQHGDAHRLEESRPDDVRIDKRGVVADDAAVLGEHLVLRRGTALDVHAQDPSRTTEHCAPAHRGGLDAG